MMNRLQPLMASSLRVSTGYCLMLPDACATYLNMQRALVRMSKIAASCELPDCAIARSHDLLVFKICCCTHVSSFVRIDCVLWIHKFCTGAAACSMLYGAVALVALVSRVRTPRKPHLHVCAQVAEPLLVGDSEQPRLLRTRNLPHSTDPIVSLCAAGNLLTRHSWGLSGTSQVLTQDVRIECTN